MIDDAATRCRVSPNAHFLQVLFEIILSGLIRQGKGPSINISKKAAVFFYFLNIIIFQIEANRYKF